MSGDWDRYETLMAHYATAEANTSDLRAEAEAAYPGLDEAYRQRQVASARMNAAWWRAVAAYHTARACGEMGVEHPDPDKFLTSEAGASTPTTNQPSVTQ